MMGRRPAWSSRPQRRVRPSVAEPPDWLLPQILSLLAWDRELWDIDPPTDFTLPPNQG